VLALCGLLALLFVGSTATVSLVEENDAFCGTCHLSPERTYVARAAKVLEAYGGAKAQGLSGGELWRTGRAAARDLAGAHRAAALNCVACHRGDNGLADRTTALALGARNAALYLTGQFDPDHSGLADSALVEGSCLRCHLDQPNLGGVMEGKETPILVEGFENHFHSYLFDPQYATQITVGCLDCHASHLEVPPIIPFFLDEERVVFPTCVQCHIDVEKGPVDLG
jgi:hypothetical protein